MSFSDLDIIHTVLRESSASTVNRTNNVARSNGLGQYIHVGCLYKLLAYAMMLLTSIRFTPTYLCAKCTNNICTYVLGYIQQCVQFVIMDVVNAIMFAVCRIPYIARLQSSKA